MKKWYTGLLSVAVLAMVGCQDKSTTGGPGATGGSNRDKPMVGQADNTFKLDAPNLKTDIKQGETKSVSLGISRGTNFDQDVALEFGQLPKGIKVNPANPAIKAGDKNVQLNIEAAKDAAVGEHNIQVTGKGAKGGPPATTSFKIEVEKPE